MLKSIFYKIMSDEQQRQKMNSLNDKTQIYKLFCQNGYTKSYDEFEKEMEDFLNSEDSKKLLTNDSGELSDEMLEMIAGGVNVKRAVTAGIATLLTTFTIGAIGSQLVSQTNVSATSTPTQVVATFDNSNEGTEQSKEDNGGPTIKQTSNKQFNNTAKNKTFRFGQRKGPGGGGASVSTTNNNAGGGGASVSATNNNAGGGGASVSATNNNAGGGATENKVEKQEQSAKKTEAAKKLFNAINKQENKQNQQLKKDVLNKLKDNTQNLKKQEQQKTEKHNKEMQTIKESNAKHWNKIQCIQKARECENLLNKISTSKSKDNQKLISQVDAFLKQDARKLSPEQAESYLKNADNLIRQMNKELNK